MNCAVRYYSRSGNTKLVADEIARSLDIKAVSVDDSEGKLNKPVDVLFIGGALYAYGIDQHLKSYLKEIDAKNVKKAAVFSTSWISKHAIEVIKEELNKRAFGLRMKCSMCVERLMIHKSKKLSSLRKRCFNGLAICTLIFHKGSS